jgi:hypothetical protein
VVIGENYMRLTHQSGERFLISVDVGLAHILLKYFLGASAACKVRNIRLQAATVEELVDAAYSTRFIPFVGGLERVLRKGSAIGKYLDFVIKSFFSIEPGQIRSEILQLLTLELSLRPKTVLEIGTASGGTLYLLSSCANTHAKMISVDLPGGLFGGGYPTWKAPIFRSFRGEKQEIVLIRGDSHSPKTVELVKELANGTLDFLFIDGDHRYSGVKKDFLNYSPFVNNGIIAFHDIAAQSPESGLGVYQFWNEIKASYKYVEIVENWGQGWGESECSSYRWSA